MNHDNAESHLQSDVATAAAKMVNEHGGFPAQEQRPPGETAAMRPTPDHGEESYIGHGRLVGLRALITGGDSGIGRAVAIAFAREGASVGLSYLDVEQTDAEETAGWVTAAGQRVALLPGDLTDRGTCVELPNRAVDALGGVDVLINNAGFQMARTHGIDELRDDDLDRVLKTNLHALFWLTRATVPLLRRGGSIINTTSIQAYEPSQTLLDYAATKAAINNFTVNLAGELGPRGIRVNAVAPGPIWTPLQPPPRTPITSNSSAVTPHSVVLGSRPRLRLPTSSWHRRPRRVTCPAPFSVSPVANRSSDLAAERRPAAVLRRATHRSWTAPRPSA